MLEIEIPKNRKKLHKQIEALKFQIEHDTNEKDRKIHMQALQQLRRVDSEHF